MSGGYSTTFRAILYPADSRPPLVPVAGLSLFECLPNIPGMRGTVGLFGIQPNTVRGRLDLTIHEKTGKYEYKLAIHPASAGMIKEFSNNIIFHPADGVERVDFKEMPSGGIVEWWHLREETPVRLHVPNGTMWTADEVRFWPSEQPLNEFGFIYVALYIIGNYARYFPDLWMRDVEQNSPLALAVEELLAMATIRMPLLTLSEMTRTYLVPAG